MTNRESCIEFVSFRLPFVSLSIYSRDDNIGWAMRTTRRHARKSVRKVEYFGQLARIGLSRITIV